jgi:hypothetical protein
MNLVDDMPAVRSAMPNNSALILTHIDSAVTADGLPNTAIAEDFRTYRF